MHREGKRGLLVSTISSIVALAPENDDCLFVMSSLSRDFASRHGVAHGVRIHPHA